MHFATPLALLAARLLCATAWTSSQPSSSGARLPFVARPDQLQLYPAAGTPSLRPLAATSVARPFRSLTGQKHRHQLDSLHRWSKRYRLRSTPFRRSAGAFRTWRLEALWASLRTASRRSGPSALHQLLLVRMLVAGSPPQFSQLFADPVGHGPGWLARSSSFAPSLPSTVVGPLVLAPQPSSEPLSRTTSSARSRRRCTLC